MMTISEALQAAWAAAAANAGTLGGFYRRRLAPPAPQNILAGVRRPEGLRQVSFEVAATAPILALGERTRGYAVQVEKAGPELLGRAVVHVSEAVNRADDPLFTTLCADLVVNLAEVASPADGAGALVRRLQHWKLFFQNVPDSGLTVAEATGLVAELGFPRLLEAAMPVGVNEVTYRIELGACVGFELSAGKVVEVFLADPAS